LYGFYLKPKYEGEVQLKSIQDQTTVYFDFGVPHIYANNSIDAMTALGYVHAQDRLWQMELMRRIAPGRLSEIFGSSFKERYVLPALVLKSLRTGDCRSR
jgi:penicillin amidase